MRGWCGMGWDFDKVCAYWQARRGTDESTYGTCAVHVVGIITLGS